MASIERDLNDLLIFDDEWTIIEELCRVFKVSFIQFFFI